METWQYILAIAAGFVAGIINTLAGSGSLFTLPLLLFLGLPANLANGTNRVGILTQTLVGAITLYKKGTYKIGKDFYYIIPTVIGSALGAYIATTTPESILKITIGSAMLFLLVVLLINYTSLLREVDAPISTLKKYSASPLLFIIGIYGGFIQLGVGIFTLAALLLVLNLTFMHANALKNIMNFFLTIPAFLIFAYNDQINWKLGCVIAIGQTIGAWVAARYASESKNASIWIRRLLVVMTLVTALKLFEII
ncbi:MAG: sulfite exporter TauE/SafE family protein [Bacteroidetes bacterium]|nr:sulfite exporter TauE/SafE family protein [Bacteroidota bacterium]